KLFLPSFLHSINSLSANNFIWCEQVGCDKPVSDTISQHRIDPLFSISFNMLIRYGSATADIAFSKNKPSLCFIVVILRCKYNGDGLKSLFVILTLCAPPVNNAV